MLIREFDQDNNNSQELAAMIQFLLSRAEDTDSQKKISVDAFLKLATNQGISLSRDRLIQLSQEPPLDNMIQNIQGDEIIFKGADSEVAPNMSVDQARATEIGRAHV